MPFNSLLLPLLGGFVFVSHFLPTAFFAARQTRERLIFYAAIAGILLLFAGRVAELAAAKFIPELYLQLSILAPFQYSFTTISAFILGSVLWYPANFFFSTEKLNRSVVDRYGNALELLLVEASASDQLVMLTMEDHKVYIGYVERQPANPDSPDPHLRIVPAMSGYRDQISKELVLTNFYQDALRNLAGEASAFGDGDRAWRLEDFVKVLPLHRIASAGLFDPRAFEAHLETTTA